MREVKASEDLKVAMGPSAAVRMGSGPSTAARIMQYYNFAIIAKKKCVVLQ